MADRDIAQVLRYLRRSFEGGGELSDGQLLQQLTTANRPAAFKALVRRHERLVFGVCRRILRDVHDAEDAFQATFLALLRKGHSISRSQALASWLYKVAFRVAINLRARRARTEDREQPLAFADSVAAPTSLNLSLEMQELRALLDEELERLPERFRAPLVLCYFEGRTLDEAAEHLGCPRGTVASRLARGRERLRVRLTRRGLAITSAALVAGLAKPGWSVAAPLTLIGSTVQFAKVGGGAAGAVISAKVLTLTAEVLRAMFIKKFITAVTVLAISASVLLMGGGVGMHVYRSAAAEPAERAADVSPPVPQESPSQQQKAPPEKEKPELPKVTVVKPVIKEVERTAGFNARLQASKTYNVTAAVNGRVASIICQEGAAVKKDDVLFELDRTALKEARQRAAANLEIARTRQAESARLADRLNKLAETRTVSTEEAQKAQATAAIDAATVRLAQLDFERAERELQAAQIKAPADGKISALRVDVGSGVTADKTVLTTISVLDPILVVFDMDQRSYEDYQKGLRDKQKSGQETTVAIKLLGEKDSHKGTRASFAESFDPKTGTISVRVATPNPGGQLLPGMSAWVYVPLGGDPDKYFLVPLKAVRNQRVDPLTVTVYVLVVNDQNVVERRDVTGVDFEQPGDLASINSGLNPNDRVIIEGADNLRPGDRVEPKRQ
jgi:RND family efflux transporter MFP subunit